MTLVLSHAKLILGVEQNLERREWMEYKPKYTNSYKITSDTKYYCNRINCAMKYSCKHYKQQSLTDTNWYGDLLFTQMCSITKILERRE